MPTMQWRLALVLLLALMMGALRAKPQGCAADTDCPGHDRTLFCGSPICIQGKCVQSPSPCSSECLEAEQRCVECIANIDCTTLGYLCDQRTHTCHGCQSHADCPEGTWCTGGHWHCSNGRCSAPPESRQPCPDLEHCVEKSHTCARCYKNEDCGPWDYCTHRVHCDLHTLECVSEPALPDNCKFCDSRSQRCTECLTHADCATKEFKSVQPFCSAPTLVQRCVSGQCTVQANDIHQDPWYSPCAHSAEECSEDRKRCIPRLCLDNSAASCSDGNECNGAERCVQQVCQAPLVATCPEGRSCDPKNSRRCLAAAVAKDDLVVKVTTTTTTTTVPTQLGGESYKSTDVPCVLNSDCANNWICRVVSRKSNRLRACRPCRNDAQCIHQETSSGRNATCNKSTGGCSEAYPNQVTVVTLQARAPILPTRATSLVTHNRTAAHTTTMTTTSHNDNDALKSFFLSSAFLSTMVLLWILFILGILLYHIGHLPLKRLAERTTDDADADDDTNDNNNNSDVKSSSRSWWPLHQYFSSSADKRLSWSRAKVVYRR